MDTIMNNLVSESKNARVKDTIPAVYDIIGIITTGTGVALLAAGFDMISGISLIFGGITVFGMSCYAKTLDV